MDIRYLTVVEWEYREFMNELGYPSPRWLDFRPDDKSFSLGTIVVLLEFSSTLKNPDSPHKTGYTGRMTARRVKQTVCNRIGVQAGWIALLYEDHPLTQEMRETAEKIMAAYDPADGKIPT